MFSQLTLLFVLFFGLWSGSVYSLTELSNHPQWMRLLHYRPTLFSSGSRSLNPHFFYHPEGANSPRLELEATIEAFNADKGEWCRFPARFHFLKQNDPRHWGQKNLEHCGDLQDWVEGLGTDEVSLVFAGAYPNNPASLFGHTLLLFSKDGRSSLRDYGVAFLAASQPSDSAIMYTWRGLTGGYQGFFEIEPFSQSVGLYNNSESRDLWTYRLDLDESERLMMAYHLWELMVHPGFRYYFFDENCSFMLLALIETAKPSVDLTSDYSLFVLPLETVKKVVKELPGSEEQGRRASIREGLYLLWDKLNLEQKNLVAQVLKGNRPVEDIADHPQSLEVVMDLLHIRLYEAKGELAPDQMQLMREAQRLRASLTHVRRTAYGFHPRHLRSPDFSHGPKRLRLFHNSSNKKAGLEVGLGLHRFEDHPAGYEEFAYIDYLNFSSSWDTGQKKWDWDHFELIQITSLDDLSLLEPRLSWRVQLGAFRQTLQESDSSVRLKGGPGLTKRWGWGSQSVFVVPVLWTNLKSGHSEFSPSFEALTILGHPNWRWVALIFDYAHALREDEHWSSLKTQLVLRPGLDWSLSIGGRWERSSYEPRSRGLDLSLSYRF